MHNEQPTNFPTFPIRVSMVNGAPMVALRDILRATGHRPFFIRKGLLPLASVQRFLRRSDKPLAPVLLGRIEAAAATVTAPRAMRT
jgi:hypothetical protein